MTEYFIDEENGSDANNGLSCKTAFKSFEMLSEHVKENDGWHILIRGDNRSTKQSDKKS